MNEGIGTVSVSVGTCFAVVLRFFQILFLNDLFAFDHTASAVGTGVPALLTSGPAAGAGLIVLDFGAGDFLAVFRAAGFVSEANPPGDPSG